MAISKVYEQIGFVNGETPINGAETKTQALEQHIGNLNKMDFAINEIDNRVVEMDSKFIFEDFKLPFSYESGGTIGQRVASIQATTSISGKPYNIDGYTPISSDIYEMYNSQKYSAIFEMKSGQLKVYRATTDSVPSANYITVRVLYVKNS